MNPNVGCILLVLEIRDESSYDASDCICMLLHLFNFVLYIQTALSEYEGNSNNFDLRGQSSIDLIGQNCPPPLRKRSYSSALA